MQGAARREHSHTAALRVHAPGGWPSFVSPIETEESSGLCPMLNLLLTSLSIPRVPQH